MLKIRIIPILLLKEDRCVKGVKFNNYRDTGNPITAAKVYDSQKADELIFLDINHHAKSNILYKLIENIANQCFMPLTVGGGIKTIEDIRKILQVGADKVAINSEAIANPYFIAQASQIFGKQCIVASVDVKKKSKNEYEVYSDGGRKATGLDPLKWIKELERLGAGEILLTSIDKEGTMSGYDLELLNMVSKSINIPLIANGGVGTLQHLVDGVKIGKASAVACSSLFHFTDQSTIKAKSYLSEAGINVRTVW